MTKQEYNKKYYREHRKQICEKKENNIMKK